MEKSMTIEASVYQADIPLISVCDPQKQYLKEGSKVVSSYFDYKVDVELNGTSCTVRRRFKDFSFLDNMLQLKAAGSILPILPEKGVSSQFSLKTTSEEDFIATRAKVL
jgi:hypothetical protein